MTGAAPRRRVGHPGAVLQDEEVVRRPLPSTPAGPLRRVLPLLGPAFVAAVAYVDPGNFATNITAGAQHGTLLVWVVVASNLLAVLVQYLSAKLGIATGWGLARNCRDHLPRWTTRGLWAQAELVAMATDLAEVLGGALALNLLFGLPLLAGGVVTGLVAFGMLALTGRGHRPYENAVVGLLAVILLGFLVDLVRSGPDASAVASGLVPRLEGTDTVLLACGILGATVMPHVIYLHASLTGLRARPLDAAGRRSLLAAQKVDIPVAMVLAGAVNLSMLVLAATLFVGSDVDTIEEAHAGLREQLGSGAALGFALALLASGLAASSVGTYSGQVVMKGFLRRQVSLPVRRGITLAPALVVLAVGVDPTRALVLSQVVLSFGIPFALVPLVLLTRRADVMGEFVNRRLTTAAGAVVAGLISVLNVFLLTQLFR
ncbi:MAG: divalent metal cation transporter [Frankiales bacterium]|nr:divalent metal cation transporter [Frankiales bacterium]